MSIEEHDFEIRGLHRSTGKFIEMVLQGVSEAALRAEVEGMGIDITSIKDLGPSPLQAFTGQVHRPPYTMLGILGWVVAFFGWAAIAVGIGLLISPQRERAQYETGLCLIGGSCFPLLLGYAALAFRDLVVDTHTIRLRLGERPERRRP